MSEETALGTAAAFSPLAVSNDKKNENDVNSLFGEEDEKYCSEIENDGEVGVAVATEEIDEKQPQFTTPLSHDGNVDKSRKDSMCDDYRVEGVAENAGTLTHGGVMKQEVDTDGVVEDHDKNNENEKLREENCTQRQHVSDDESCDKNNAMNEENISDEDILNGDRSKDQDSSESSKSSESLESSSSDENSDDEDDEGLGSTSALEVDTGFTRVSGAGEDQQYRPSAYELQRAERIRRNTAYLAKLGLDRDQQQEDHGDAGDDVASALLSIPKKGSHSKKRRNNSTLYEKSRSSVRLEKKSSDYVFNEEDLSTKAFGGSKSSSSSKIISTSDKKATSAVKKKRKPRTTQFVWDEYRRMEVRRRRNLRQAFRNSREAEKELRIARRNTDVYNRKLERKRTFKERKREVLEKKREIEERKKEGPAIKRELVVHERILEEATMRRRDIWLAREETRKEKMRLVNERKNMKMNSRAQIANAIQKFPFLVRTAHRSLKNSVFEQCGPEAKKVFNARGKNAVSKRRNLNQEHLEELLQSHAPEKEDQSIVIEIMQKQEKQQILNEAVDSKYETAIGVSSLPAVSSTVKSCAKTASLSVKSKRIVQKSGALEDAMIKIANSGAASNNLTSVAATPNTVNKTCGDVCSPQVSRNWAQINTPIITKKVAAISSPQPVPVIPLFPSPTPTFTPPPTTTPLSISQSKQENMLRSCMTKPLLQPTFTRCPPPTIHTQQNVPQKRPDQSFSVRKVNGPVVAEVAKALQRGWLESDRIELNSNGNEVYVPQVGDTILYYPLGHKTFLEQYPDERAKRSKLKLRIPPWERPLDMKIDIITAVSNNSASITAPLATGSANYVHTSMDGSLHNNLDNPDQLHLSSPTLFPPHWQTLPEAQLGWLCRVEATQPEFAHTSVTPLPNPFLPLCVKLKPLTPFPFWDQKLAYDSEATRTHKEAVAQLRNAWSNMFSVLFFPSILPNFILPFVWAYQRRNVLCVGDRIKLFHEGDLFLGSVLDVTIDQRKIGEEQTSFEYFNNTALKKKRLDESIPKKDRTLLQNWREKMVDKLSTEILKKGSPQPTHQENTTISKTPQLSHDWPVWEGIIIRWDDGSTCGISSWEVEKTHHNFNLLSGNDDGLGVIKAYKPLELNPDEVRTRTMDELLRVQLHFMITTIAQHHPDAMSFVNKVDEKYAPDYLTRVPINMYLNKILKRLKPPSDRTMTSLCYYRSLGALLSDISEMANNCILYNHGGSDIVKAAMRLTKDLKREVMAVQRKVDKIRPRVKPGQENKLIEKRVAGNVADSPISLQKSTPGKKKPGRKPVSKKKSPHNNKSVTQPQPFPFLNRSYLETTLPDSTTSTTTSLKSGFHWIPQAGDKIYYSVQRHTQFLKHHADSITNPVHKQPIRLPPQPNTASHHRGGIGNEHVNWRVGTIIHIRYLLPTQIQTFSDTEPSPLILLSFHFPNGKKGFIKTSTVWRPCQITSQNTGTCLCCGLSTADSFIKPAWVVDGNNWTGSCVASPIIPLPRRNRLIDCLKELRRQCVQGKVEVDEFRGTFLKGKMKVMEASWMALKQENENKEEKDQGEKAMEMNLFKAHFRPLYCLSKMIPSSTAPSTNDVTSPTTESKRKIINSYRITPRELTHLPNPNLCLDLILSRLSSGYYRSTIAIIGDLHNSFLAFSYQLVLLNDAKNKICLDYALMKTNLRRIAFKDLELHEYRVLLSQKSEERDKMLLAKKENEDTRKNNAHAKAVHAAHQPGPIFKAPKLPGPSIPAQPPLPLSLKPLLHQFTLTSRYYAAAAAIFNDVNLSSLSLNLFPAQQLQQLSNSSTTATTNLSEMMIKNANKLEKICNLEEEQDYQFDLLGKLILALNSTDSSNNNKPIDVFKENPIIKVRVKMREGMEGLLEEENEGGEAFKNEKNKQIDDADCLDNLIQIINDENGIKVKIKLNFKALMASHSAAPVKIDDNEMHLKKKITNYETKKSAIDAKPITVESKVVSSNVTSEEKIGLVEISTSVDAIPLSSDNNCKNSFTSSIMNKKGELKTQNPIKLMNFVGQKQSKNGSNSNTFNCTMIGNSTAINDNEHMIPTIVERVNPATVQSNPSRSNTSNSATIMQKEDLRIQAVYPSFVKPTQLISNCKDNVSTDAGTKLVYNNEPNSIVIDQKENLTSLAAVSTTVQSTELQFGSIGSITNKIFSCNDVNEENVAKGLENHAESTPALINKASSNHISAPKPNIEQKENSTSYSAASIPVESKQVQFENRNNISNEAFDRNGANEENFAKDPKNPSESTSLVSSNTTSISKSAISVPIKAGSLPPPLLLNPSHYQNSRSLSTALFSKPNRRYACVRCQTIEQRTFSYYPHALDTDSDSITRSEVTPFISCRLRKAHSNPDFDMDLVRNLLVECWDMYDVEEEKVIQEQVLVDIQAYNNVGKGTNENDVTANKNEMKASTIFCNEKISDEAVQVAAPKLPMMVSSAVSIARVDVAPVVETNDVFASSVCIEKDYAIGHLAQTKDTRNVLTETIALAETKAICDALIVSNTPQNERQEKNKELHIEDGVDKNTVILKKDSKIDDKKDDDEEEDEKNNPNIILEKATRAMDLSKEAISQAQLELRLPLELTSEFLRRTFIMDVADGHYMNCHICGFGGDVLCCENCALVGHMFCYQIEKVPDGDWFCRNCERKKKGTIATSITSATDAIYDEKVKKLETILKELRWQRIGTRKVEFRLGMRLLKNFNDLGDYSGVVTVLPEKKYSSGAGSTDIAVVGGDDEHNLKTAEENTSKSYYRVRYDDGDEEDMSEDELESCVRRCMENEIMKNIKPVNFNPTTAKFNSSEKDSNIPNKKIHDNAVMLDFSSPLQVDSGVKRKRGRGRPPKSPLSPVIPSSAQKYHMVKNEVFFESGRKVGRPRKESLPIQVSLDERVKREIAAVGAVSINRCALRAEASKTNFTKFSVRKTTIAGGSQLYNRGGWLPDEHLRLISAIKNFGLKNCSLLKALLKTRDIGQIKLYIYRNKLDRFAPKSGTELTYIENAPIVVPFVNIGGENKEAKKKAKEPVKMKETKKNIYSKKEEKKDTGRVVSLVSKRARARKPLARFPIDKSTTSGDESDNKVDSNEEDGDFKDNRMKLDKQIRKEVDSSIAEPVTSQSERTTTSQEHQAEKNEEGEAETPTKKRSRIGLKRSCGRSPDVNNGRTPPGANHRYQQMRPSSQKSLYLRSNETRSNKIGTRTSPRIRSPSTRHSKRVKENVERKCAEAVVIDKKKINNDEEYKVEEKCDIKKDKEEKEENFCVLSNDENSSDQQKKAKRKLIQLLEVPCDGTCSSSARSSSSSPISQAIDFDQPLNNLQTKLPHNVDNISILEEPVSVVVVDDEILPTLVSDKRAGSKTYSNGDKDKIKIEEATPGNNDITEESATPKSLFIMPSLLINNNNMDAMKIGCPDRSIVLESGPAPHCPPGWLIESVKRKNAKVGRNFDRYWYSPFTNQRFRSVKEVTRFLDILKQHQTERKTNEQEVTDGMNSILKAPKEEGKEEELAAWTIFTNHLRSSHAKNNIEKLENLSSAVTLPTKRSCRLSDIRVKSSPEPNTRASSKSNTVAKLNKKLTNVSCNKSNGNDQCTSSIKNPRNLSTSVKSSIDGAVPAPDCPPGWLMKCVSRGSSNGKDRYWYSPVMQKKFRSIKELTRFLDILKQQQNTAQQKASTNQINNKNDANDKDIALMNEMVAWDIFRTGSPKKSRGSPVINMGVIRSKRLRKR